MDLIDILSRVAAGGFGLLIIAGFAFPVLFFLCFLIRIPISSIKEKRAEKEIKRKECLKEDIKHESQRLLKLQELNHSYNFKDIKATYEFTKSCVSRQEFNRLKLADFLDIVILENKAMITRLEKYAAFNQKENVNYLAEIDKLRNLPTYESSTERKEIEESLFQESILKPQLTYNFLIKVKYTTPKKKDTVYKKAEYTREQIISRQVTITKAEIEKERQKAQREKERALMTDKLRMEVLRRDNFRCQICGASQADGVKLHVDHIKPVSKGGKTELSNLRTLCDRCNLGKRDYYDSNGNN